MTRLSKLPTALLAVSILLNFAAAGFIFTQHIRGQVTHELAGRSGEGYPPEFARAYRGALRSDWRNLLSEVRALRQAREAQHALMIAETFDRAAFEEAQVELRTAQIAVMQTLQTALPTALEALSHDMRRALSPLKLRSTGINLQRIQTAK